MRFISQQAGRCWFVTCGMWQGHTTPAAPLLPASCAYTRHTSGWLGSIQQARTSHAPQHNMTLQGHHAPKVAVHQRTAYSLLQSCHTRIAPALWLHPGRTGGAAHPLRCTPQCPGKRAGPAARSCRPSCPSAPPHPPLPCLLSCPCLQGMTSVGSQVSARIPCGRLGCPAMQPFPS